MQIVFSAILIAALVFVSMLLGTLFGGIAGWVVEAVFPFVISTLNQLTGLTLTGFEMGAVLGFFGGFFRSSHTSK